jgi:uncharacterized protein (TIGR00290 family)
MQKIGFSSWSGGKDGCLALFRAEKMGIKIPYLFTMIEEGGERSRSHGLRLELLRAQAEALGKTWEYHKATWGDYEAEYLGYLHEKQAQGIEIGIFGDIDLDAHRGWVEGVCQMENLQASLPLWQEARRDLIREFIREGFIARIVTIDTRKVAERYLGRIFTEELIEEFEAMGVDACGENGEFHTVVLDGPNFLHPIEVEVGEAIAIDSYRQLDLKIKARKESLE